MTRDERIGRGVAAYDAADHRKINPVEAALDAALADFGGLDGLDALRVDRDRLREALRRFTGSGDIPRGAGVDDLRSRLAALDQTARNVLRESEAGTKC